MTLKELQIGKSAVIKSVGSHGALRQHFLDMGMIPGVEITVVKLAPMGDPMEVQIHGYELTLRLEEADQIEIDPIVERSRSHKGAEYMRTFEHPGLGEEGKYHSKEDEHPLPEGTQLTYALVGNQNCGKTTLFNQLTGANQHVGKAVHRCIHAVIHLIEDHAEKAQIPVRFAATKAIEGDPLILEQLKLDQNEMEMLEHIVKQMETERKLDRSAAIADMRFDFIESLCEQTVVKPKESKERIRSEKIDRVLTGKYTAIPCFVGIMVLVFYLTFNVIGAWLQGILQLGIDKISVLTDQALTAAHVNHVIHSLVIEGIFTGVGSVLSFLPIIVTLFFFLSLMEDSGYIARVAFVMDKVLRKIGLSGRSIVPMLIGFGCTVPAVMATRTLTSERDRKMTILLTPFMSCTAKLPIYSFFVNAFFPKRGGLIMAGLYLSGIMIGILIAFLYKGTLFKGEPVPFVMELPNYRLPGMKNVAQLLWEKAKDFLQKAFSVILVATIVVWFLQRFDLQLNMVEDSAHSILAMVAGVLVPVFSPLGLGDWRIVTSLISGFMAKESVVSTLGVLFNGNITAAITPLAASSLLVFSLLYSPCVAAIASVKRELGTRWAVGLALWQCMIAWIAALIVRFIGLVI